MGTLSMRYSERLIMRFGAQTMLIPGLVLIVVGLAPVHAGARRRQLRASHVLPVLILLGVGAGVSFPALMTLAMSGATPEDAGLASGLVNTTAQVGGALGPGRSGHAVARPAADNLLADGESAASALTGGYHLAFLIGAGLVLASVIVAVLVLEPVKAHQAEVHDAGESAPAEREPAYSEAV